jgi:hypothetical protein
MQFLIAISRLKLAHVQYRILDLHAPSGRRYSHLQQWVGHRDIASTMVYLKGMRNRDIQARLKQEEPRGFCVNG